MNGLQSSFNSNRHWAKAYLAKSYILKTDKYPWIGVIAGGAAPANQFGRKQENERDQGDYLTPFFLVFFFVYAICRIML